MNEAREEEEIPQPRSTSNSRQQAGNPATGYLEAKVVILGSQGQFFANRERDDKLIEL